MTKAQRLSCVASFRNTAVIALVVAAMSAVQTPSATAATGLTIQPVKVSYTLAPGDQVSDSIVLKNPAGDAVVYPSVQDFIPVAGTSNLEFVGRAPGVTSVADWVKIAAPASFGFRAGEEKEIKFTVSVPKDAEPGSHFGGIFFRAADAPAASNKNGVSIGTQVGMLVLVTVPGSHLQKGRVAAFDTAGFIQKGPVDFRISFENTGTVYFEPKGEITVKNMFGTTVAKVPVAGQIVLPTGVRDIAVSWPAGLLLGPYTADLALYDGDGNLITAKAVKFFALPVWYVVGILFVLLALYVLLVFLKNRVHFTISLKK